MRKVIGRRQGLATAFLGWLAASACGSQAPPSADGAPQNLAQGRPATLLPNMSEAPAATDGTLAAEGTARADALFFSGLRSAVVVDLGAMHRVGALLLQADAADVYWVEVSSDGLHWTVAWRVPPLREAAGFRTQTTVLAAPLSGRWLRIRPTTSVSPALFEIQAFERAPAAWPALDSSQPRSSLPLWPGLGQEKRAALYEALAAVLVWLVGWGLLRRRCPGPPREDRLRKGLLLGVAAASLLAWPNFLNFHYFGAIHKWEFFHYYLGGKYFRELGYTGLYSCAAAADAQDGVDLSARVLRDLRDDRMVPATAAVADAACRSRFSPERWEAFRRDARFFRETMGEERWARARSDHGFNATPAWVLVGGFLAGLAPVSHPQVGLLALLDVGFLLATFLVLGRTFGLEAACIAAGYFGLNTLAPFGWTGGSFLRYDWLFWLVAGIAALKVQCPALAGFALGYSALLRVFPACAIAGLVLGAVVQAASARDPRRLLREWRFVAGVAAALLTLTVGSSLAAGGAGIWREFARNTTKHMAVESVNSVGLQPFLVYSRQTRMELTADPLLAEPYAPWEASRAEEGRRLRVAHAVAALGFVLLLGLAVRGTPDWVAAVLGIGLVPMLLTLASYYYCVLIVFAALSGVSRVPGLALASFTWLTNVILRLWSGDGQYAWLSLGVVVLVSGITVAFAWAGTGPDAAGDATRSP